VETPHDEPLPPASAQPEEPAPPSSATAPPASPQGSLANSPTSEPFAAREAATAAPSVLQIPTPPPREYPDRSSGLTVFGIIQILLGLLALLGIPVILLSAAMSRRATGTSMPAGTYVQTIITYALVAAVLFTLGVGSIRARRWAWALTLISSWIWLIVGIVMTVMLTAVMPAGFMNAMKAAGNGAAPLSRGAIAIILTIIIVFLAFFLIVVPAGFLLFYHREDVRETCKRRDLKESWTERVPLPLLAVSLLFAYGVIYYLLDSFTAPIVPFFGRWLTGWSGGLACLLLAALDAFLAISIFQRRVVGWWIAVIALAVRLLSSILTILKGNLFEAYSRMGVPQGQLQVMNSNPAMRSGAMLWSTLVFSVALLGYLIWVKRYFARPAQV
jgi:uncharacterized membrane protein